MDAFDRIEARAVRKRRSHGAERLAWLTPPPPRVGMCVREADGALIGRVDALVVGEAGGVVALEVVCADARLGRRRLPPCAVRVYGEGLVSLYFRRDFEALPRA